MNLTSITPPPVATMSSLEIAELTGKEHRNVCRDIRAMLAEIYGEDPVPRFGDTYIHPQNGQEYPIFRLPKRETIILISGYSLKMRAAIVDRWLELEEQNPVAYISGVLRNMASKIPLGESKDLYVIHFTDGTCKVGRSNDVPFRVNTVRTASGRSIRSYYHIPDKGNFEQPLLKVLEPMRLEGEFVQEGYLGYVLDLVRCLTQVTELTPIYTN